MRGPREISDRESGCLQLELVIVISNNVQRGLEGGFYLYLYLFIIIAKEY